MAYLAPVPSRSMMKPVMSRHAERGLSLVELLVGLAIGLLVTLAALGIISFTRISSTTVTDTVQMQQDATIAMRIIGQQIRQARSVGLQTTQADGRVGYTAYTGSTPPGAPSDVAVFGVDGNAAQPDTITISTGVLNGLTTDCLGFGPPAPADTIVSTLDLQGGTLRCAGTTTAAQPMIDNVLDFQVWYGVRDPVTGNLQYLAQPAAAAWPTVRTVLVCLHLVSATTTAAIPAPGNLPLDCANQPVAWDGRIQRVFRQVFSLRNLAGT